MAGTDHALVKCSGNKVEGEDSSRTANCLRGRLLAERLASRNAREEAEQLGIKVLEVESLLKQEVKSRKRAEKKLKFLMKRLECMNISYAAESDESEQSDVDSSISCRASSTTQKIEILQKSDLFLNSEEINDSQLSLSLWSRSEMGSNENSNSSAFEASDLSCVDEPRPLLRMESSADEEALNGANNLMALVPVSMPEDERIEPEVLDATVKQVLESLRRAKEQLQSSMERRRRMSINMIKVG